MRLLLRHGGSKMKSFLNFHHNSMIEPLPELLEVVHAQINEATQGNLGKN